MTKHSHHLMIIIIFIASSSSAPIENLVFTGCPLQKASAQAQVFITISSLAVAATERGVVKRQLELNWVSPNAQPGDSVGLYDRDPALNPEAPPLHALDPTRHHEGYFRSDVEIPVQFFNLTCLAKNPCLGFWAAYKDKNGSVLDSSCLQTRPFWMYENRKYLQSLLLHEAMIPGSHDSGSFYYENRTNTIIKYKYAQEEPIFDQLVYGLRYFDLRIGYYRHSQDKYYINHNFLKTEHSVKSVLNQVKQFLDNSKEIVILDFHNFPVGFDNSFIHMRLMQIILRTFRDYLIPTDAGGLTFGELWAKNKRVLVSYDNRLRYLHGKLLWPAIPRAWGNKQRPEDLKEYFAEFFRGPVPRGLWASMAELTPDARTIVLHPDAGLRSFAQVVNRNVTHWFRDLYWQRANIVATDYFLGNNIIDVAIDTNRYKALCPRKLWSS
ncbi:PI-PLC X domain-containing protein 1-like [Uloborus diversus]|uniref:PI-PLC X domain-containing protein 1-like n=1 Tax=Uloborus diversus TaxID=327109 RepID=UPI0024094D37|nr:PI-PLC X domain-containing protein 1-like [Uloborus diversus]